MLCTIYSQDCEKDKGKERPPDLRNILANAAERRICSGTKSAKKAENSSCSSDGGARDNEEVRVALIIFTFVNITQKNYELKQH